MGYCTNCGAELGIGRFCTNCGQPIAGRHESAPLAPSDDPPGPRYPLFADEAPADDAPPAASPPSSPAGRPLPDAEPEPDPDEPEPAGRWWLAWLAAGVVVLLLLVAGAVQLVGRDGEAEAPDDQAVDQASTDGADGTDGTDGRDRPRGDRGNRPDPDTAPEVDPASVTSLSGLAAPAVPSTAPPSNDSSGAPVSFEADHLVDGDTQTCWRMAGDGTGATLEFTFSQPVVLTSVGLVNGYAKDDWYAGNRRVLAVVWRFDDGTAVRQRFGESEELQLREMTPVETTTVRLRIREVSEPGSGPNGRDFTPISEVAFEGVEAP